MAIKMKKCCFLLLLFVCGAGLFGQLPNPQSRWLTSAGIGLDVTYGDLSANQGTSIDGTIARQTTLTQHFRVSRLLDLGLQLGFQRTVINGRRDVIDNASGLILLTNWSSLRKNILLGFQPRMNYRLGQGDLALSVTAGAVAHRNQTSFRSPELGRAIFSSAPLVDFYYDLKVGYTYWPTARFGVEVSLSRTDLRHGDNRSNLDEAGNYIFTAENFINPTQAFDPGAFQFMAESAQAVFFSLAIVRRW